MKTFKKSPLLMAAMLMLSASAFAQKAGDTIVSVGLAGISPDTSLGKLTSTGPAAVPFNAATNGATASIDNVYTLAIGAMYMFTDNIGAELSIGIPPKFKVDVNLPSGAHPDAASAREVTPALVAKYLFGTPNSQWRPFLGIGIAHASFSSVKANTADPLINSLASGGAKLSSSWAPVYDIGVIYNINDRLSINAAVSYLPLKTTATFVGTGGTVTTGKLTLDPTFYVVKLGYKF